ncbi:MAG: hypothetical protein GY696_05210 [Gammaproteobacteria bacterium]|nr:hypothetical protein [Gammaproteobacteria bacterium]
MVHTFSPERLAGCHISAEGILRAGPASTASRVQLVNLAPYDQGISKGTTLCSALVTKAPQGLLRGDAAPITDNHIKTS